MILEKIKGPADTPRRIKRCKADLMAKFITDDDYLAALKEKEKKDEHKRGGERKKKASKLIEDERSIENFFDEENTHSEEETMDALNAVLATWAQISQPVQESEVKGHWYAAIYNTPGN